MSMMRNGEQPVTQREKAAARELSKLYKESRTLMAEEEPRDIERLHELAEMSRVLLPMVGSEEQEDEV